MDFLRAIYPYDLNDKARNPDRKKETFSLFYLFDENFADLLFFSFLKGKMCAPQKLGVSEILRA